MSSGLPRTPASPNKRPQTQSRNTSNPSQTTELPAAERQRILEETQNHYYSISIDNFLHTFFPDSDSDSDSDSLDNQPEQSEESVTQSSDSDSEDNQSEDSESTEQTELDSWRKKMGVKAAKELKGIALYSTITEFMNFLLEGQELEFRDVHLQPDPTWYDGLKPKNKPDFIAVKKDEVEGCCGTKNHMCWRHCQLVADAKFQNEDPFEPLLWRQEIEEALKQILHYLLDLAYYQHRTASYLILFFPGAARIVRWTPRQVVYTDRFNFKLKTDFNKFRRFVRSFGSPQANRGLDSHFTRADEGVAKEAVAVFLANEKDIKLAGFSVPKSSDIWELHLPELTRPNPFRGQPSMGSTEEASVQSMELTGTSSAASTEPTVQSSAPSMEPTDHQSSASPVEPTDQSSASTMEPIVQPSMELIIGRIGRYRPSLCGRNGKYFVGYEKGNPESIWFVKANWAYTGGGRVSESEVYEKLKGTQSVQEMIYGGYPKDIEDLDYTLKDSEYLTPSTKEQLRNDAMQTGGKSSKGKAEGDRSYPEQRLHFLVLPFVRPLSTFRNGYELVEGLRGGLQGLLDLHRAGYLHRDVSHSNIALARSGDDVKGVLQDFDFAVELDATRKSSHSRTGTFLFLSVALLGRSPHAHELIDDIESSYHILTTHTFPHWRSDYRVDAEELIKSYNGKDAGDVKEREMSGNHASFRHGDIQADIDILGAIISLFRRFLAPRYLLEEFMRKAFVENRKDLVIQLCSKLEISADELDEFLQSDFISAPSLDTDDKQEKLLRFLILFLQIVIKQHKERLEGLTHNEPNVVDSILGNNNKKRKGEGLESSTTKKLQGQSTLQKQVFQPS
ncbi:hypothetical protein BT69DRAFT_1288255 [Atractiella rhizophila]|nr:hypothetical protein BT69DRAFT_1288255 [Atractiella rhizophila]